MPVITREGKKRVLLVNKSQNAMEVQLAGGTSAQMEYVDQTTGFDPAKKISLPANKFTLNGFSVAAVTLQ
jgi:hypothetical protein